MSFKPIPRHMRQALVHDTISHINKLHIAIGRKSIGEYVEYKFDGDNIRSRMLFQFEPDGLWHKAKSFELDVWPYLIWAKNMKH